MSAHEAALLALELSDVRAEKERLCAKADFANAALWRQAELSITDQFIVWIRGKSTWTNGR